MQLFEEPPTVCVDFTSESIVVERAVRAIHPRLNGLVTGWAGLAEEAAEPVSRRHVTGAGMMLVVGLGSPPELSPDGSGESFQLPPTAFVGPPRTVAVRSRSVPGGSRFMIVELSAPAAFRLFDVPLREMDGCLIDVDDIAGAALRDLPGRLAEAGSWAERFRVLDQVLLEGLRDGPALEPGISRAWNRLAQNGGRSSVTELAEISGYSRRHLNRLFQQYVGLSPKAAARMLRLRRALALLRRRGLGSLATIAVECGYFDESHLHAEVRTVMGVTPRAFVLEAVTASRMLGAAGHPMPGAVPPAPAIGDWPFYSG